MNGAEPDTRYINSANELMTWAKAHEFSKDCKKRLIEFISKQSNPTCIEMLPKDIARIMGYEDITEILENASHGNHHDEKKQSTTMRL